MLDKKIYKKANNKIEGLSIESIDFRINCSLVDAEFLLPGKIKRGNLSAANFTGYANGKYVEAAYGVDLKLHQVFWNYNVHHEYSFKALLIQGSQWEKETYDKIKNTIESFTHESATIKMNWWEEYVKLGKLKIFTIQPSLNKKSFIIHLDAYKKQESKRIIIRETTDLKQVISEIENCLLNNGFTRKPHKNKSYFSDTKPCNPEILVRKHLANHKTYSTYPEMDYYPINNNKIMEKIKALNFSDKELFIIYKKIGLCIFNGNKDVKKHSFKWLNLAAKLLTEEEYNKDIELHYALQECYQKGIGTKKRKFKKTENDSEDEFPIDCYSDIDEILN